jgi:hypothetical protein
MYSRIFMTWKPDGVEESVHKLGNETMQRYKQTKNRVGCKNISFILGFYVSMAMKTLITLLFYNAMQMVTVSNKRIAFILQAGRRHSIITQKPVVHK